MGLSIKTYSLFIAVLCSGLSAGLFYAWEVSVIPGTRLVSAKSYLETMQSINRAILNPAFFIIFFGTLLFLLNSTYLQYRIATDLSFWLMLAALITYLLGTFGVTVFGNVPLNETLDAVNLEGLTDEIFTNHRKAYEQQWNQLHTIRTVFSVLAFVSVLFSAFLNKANHGLVKLIFFSLLV